MFEAFFLVFAMVGAVSLAYALLAIAADYVFPAMQSKPWRVNRRRPAATYRK